MNSNKLLAAVQLNQLGVNQWITLLSIVVIALVALFLVNFLARKIEARVKRKDSKGDSHKLAATTSSALSWTLNVAIVGITVLAILDVIGIATRPALDRIWQWAMTHGVKIAFTLVLTFVALKAADFIATRLSVLLSSRDADLETQKRQATLSSIIGWVLQTSILIVGALMLLAQIGINVGPVLAAAGVVGLAVGFGAQTLVQDVINGFFILLEDQIRVGDVVNLDGKGGLVEKITLRTIRLRDFSGSVLFVRCGKIEVVTNLTKDFSFYVIDLGVAYRENIDDVVKIMKEVAADLKADPEYKDDILEDLEVAGLEKFSDSSVMLKARIKTVPIKQWRVGREFNRRLKMKFDELGVEIPFPHVTVYAGQDKRGESPPMRVEVLGRDLEQDKANQPNPSSRIDH